MIQLIINEPVGGLTDRTNYLWLGGNQPVQMNLQKGSRGSMTLQFIIRSNDSYRPTVGSPIYFYEFLDGVTPYRVFSGTIDTIEDKWIGDRGDHSPILTCVSLEQQFDLLQVRPTKTYINKTCGFIITDLLNTIATGVPVTAGTIHDGPVIPSAVYTPQDKLTDVFNALATTANFIWYVDNNTAELNFHEESTVAAPLTLHSSNILWETLDYKQQRSDYRNRQTQTVSFAAFSASNKMFSGNGITNNFNLPWAPDSVLTAILTTSTQALAIGEIIPAGSPVTDQPLPGDTVTITPFRSPAITEDPYTFVSTLDNTLRNQVLIDTTPAQTLQNLVDAINAEPTTRGIKFSLPTWENDSCNADQPAVGATSFILRVKNPGSGGNGIQLTFTGTHFEWSNFSSPPTAQTAGGTDGTIQVLNVGSLPAANVQNDVYYQRGLTNIYCTAPVPLGVSLSISYNRLGEDSISVEDTSQVTSRAALEHGTGKYQQGVQDTSNTDARAGYLAALQALNYFGDLPAGQMPVIFQFVTDTAPGLLPGQFLDITLIENPVGTPALIDGNYLVQQCQATLVPGMETLGLPYGHLRWTIDVVNLPGVSNYLALWENLVIIPKYTSSPNNANNSPGPSSTPSITPITGGGTTTTGSGGTTGAGQAWVQEVPGLAVKQSAQDLVVDASDNTKVSSATYTFVSGDVGKSVNIVGGAGWTTGSYPISSVSSGVAKLASSPAPVNTTGGQWNMTQPGSYALTWKVAISAYTQNPIIILSKNGTALTPFKSTDIGYHITPPGGDYSVSGNIITFATPPSPGDALLATYFPDGLAQAATTASGSQQSIKLAAQATDSFTPHNPPGTDPANVDVVIGTTQPILANITASGLPNLYDVVWSLDPSNVQGTNGPIADPTRPQTGAPTVYQDYTAPAAVPSNPVVTLIATSKTDGTKKAAVTIHIVNPPSGLYLVAHDDPSSSGNIVMTSPDGATWTDRNTPLPDTGETVAVGAGLYVIGCSGNSGTEQIATSPDGVTWTARSTPADNRSVQKIIFSGGQFVALYVDSGFSHFAVMTSPDGITWTSHSIPTPIGGWQDLCYSPDLGLYAAVGNNHIMTSSDGATWTNQTITGGSLSLNCIAWGNGIFVTLGGVAGSGAHLVTSTDGSTWTVQSDPAGNTDSWLGITFGSSKFVAVSGGPTTGQRAMTSADGTTWTLHSTPNMTWDAVGYGSGLFVACADQALNTNAVMTSPDGSTWTLQTTPSVRFCEGVAFG